MNANMRRSLCMGVALAGTLAGLVRPAGAQTAESINENASRAQALVEQGAQLYRAQNYAAAAPLFLEAAQLGDAGAQLQVGWHYEFGKGVQQNLREAVRWYLAAARQGKAVAQGNLGNMYEQGRGIAQNWMKAAYWFAQSAKQNDPGGLYSLARAYEFGIGVPQNRSTALALYEKAAARGNPNAPFAVQNLRQIGGMSFRTEQERQLFGLLPHNLPRDPAGRVFRNANERLAYLKGERDVMDAAQAWRTYDLDKRQYDQERREYDDGRRNGRPTEPMPPGFPRPGT